MTNLEKDITTLKTQTQDERIHKALQHILEAHTKLSEMSLSIHLWATTGLDEEGFYKAYNQFIRGREFDD